MYEDEDAFGAADGVYASDSGAVSEDGPCSQFTTPIYAVYMQL
jgi:hypothetical protein